MSNGGGGGGGNKRNRGGGGGGGGQGGGSQQRRRRSGGSGSQGGGNRPQAPNGPAMTALGESTYEAVFDHGGAGYGVWFDGVVRDDPMYKQFWKGTGTRPLYVRIEEDKIVLLKELDRDLPPSQLAAQNDETLNAIDEDVDAAIEEAVAEAMAAAEAAVSETDEKTYSPEEAAALFAAGGEAGDQPVVQADEASSDEPEAKPKRRTVRKRVTPKVEAADDED